MKKERKNKNEEIEEYASKGISFTAYMKIEVTSMILMMSTTATTNVLDSSLHLSSIIFCFLCGFVWEF